MKRYKILIPILLESKSNFDKHDFTSSVQLEFDFNDSFNSIDYQLVGKNNEYSVCLDNLIADNRENAAIKTEEFLNILLPTCSLIVQSKNSNQHYTHIKLTYEISQINFLSESTIEEKIKEAKMEKSDNIISLKDQLNITESLSITSTITIDFTGLNSLLAKYQNDKDFVFILNCYYRSLSSTDAITKYYNAFTVIEFIETTFKNDIVTNLLMSKDDQKHTIEVLEKIISQNTNRIISRVKSLLSSATLESRKEKLISVIQDVFEIKNIQNGAIQLDIDDTFIAGIIKIRNSLFHGKSFTSEEIENIFKTGIKLIVLIEHILLKWDSINKR